MEALVPKPFRGSVPDISSRGAHSGVSALGLWHWLPASFFDGLEKQDSWPSFFSSLEGPSPDSKAEKRDRFLAQWLAGRASLWSKELSSSQWQVILPCSVHFIQKHCCSVVDANSQTWGSILIRRFYAGVLYIHFAWIFHVKYFLCCHPRQWNGDGWCFSHPVLVRMPGTPAQSDPGHTTRETPEPHPGVL